MTPKVVRFPVAAGATRLASDTGTIAAQAELGLLTLMQQLYTGQA